MYCVEIVECVPNRSVDYGYLVEMLRWVPGGNVRFCIHWNVEYVPSGSVEYEYQVGLLIIYRLEMLSMCY